MTLAHTHLRTLVKQSLEAAPAVSGYIRRSAARPMPEQEKTGVVVRVLGGPGRPVSISAQAPMDWNATVSVICVARADVGQAADEAAGQLIKQVYARLMSDQTLLQAGFVRQKNVDVLFDEDDFDDRIGSAELRIQYRWRGASDSLEIPQ